jgi:hypothetical protein
VSVRKGLAELPSKNFLRDARALKVVGFTSNAIGAAGMISWMTSSFICPTCTFKLAVASSGRNVIAG